MKVLVTGSEGFVAKNLIVRLGELENYNVIRFTRQTSEDHLTSIVADVDAVIHLAGVNRPPSPEAFIDGNVGLTEKLCKSLVGSGRKVPVIFSSSVQAAFENHYGKSKREAENALWNYSEKTGSSVYIYRLPNVFGKWCKPNYNSAVATFCHNIAHGLPIKINDETLSLSLVYVDDLVDEFIRVLRDQPPVCAGRFNVVPVVYKATVGELARQIECFRDGRTSLSTERVGVGLTRALYSTYVSYLAPQAFSYKPNRHEDSRGVFVEMLKTKDSGQVSYFTAHPGMSRGGHYHHSKTEKFLVIKGEARFGFRHILTNETYELFTTGEQPQIVESIPGWSHDITNVGEDEMLVILWANEVFDREHPDTFTYKV